MEEIGTDIRTLRKHRGLTLQTVADELGRSVGWLSQVERGISRPEDEEVQALAKVFDVPPALLDKPATGPIVRKGTHRALPPRARGLVETLLSPDLTDDFEVVHSTFAPGSVRPTPVVRSTQELAYLVSGKLDLWIGDETFTLHAGDSARLRGEPFRWANPYSDPAIAIWVIAPPVY